MIHDALLAVSLAFSFFLGLIIGSFLNVVIYRVPAGISLNRPSQCPNCDERVRPWQNVPLLSWMGLRGKCANCGTKISARYPLVELGTGVAFVAVVWASLAGTGAETMTRAALIVVTIAYLYFAAISIVLTMIDLDTRRLPNSIVLPSYIVAAALFTLACLLGADWGDLIRAAIGGAVLYGFYLLLRFIRPDGMGGGDVKLAGVVGVNLAWLGWGSLVVGAFSAFVLGGVFGIALIMLRRAGRKSAIPFGPWIILGAWVGITVGEPLTNWYLGLLPAA